MPRIAPIALDDLDDEIRSRIYAGVATGMYSTTLPLQIVANSGLAFRALDEGYKAHFRRGVIPPRLQELLRLRSAQLSACEPCSLSRKEDSVTEADVACLIELNDQRYSNAEIAALRFLDLLATDYHAIDDETIGALHQMFSAEEIVELGWLCTQLVATHRFMHVLDVLGTGEPVVAARSQAAGPVATGF